VDKDVAKIAAETMNNYLMFEKILKCQVVPAEKVHAEMWKGAGQHFRRIPREVIHAAQVNKRKSEDVIGRNNSRLVENLHKKNKKFAELGIDYQFQLPSLKGVILESDDAREKRLQRREEIKLEDDDDDDDDDELKAEIKEEEEEDEDESAYSMIVDSSEDEITVKTPPKAVKKSLRKRKRKDPPLPTGAESISPQKLTFEGSDEEKEEDLNESNETQQPSELKKKKKNKKKKSKKTSV